MEKSKRKVEELKIVGGEEIAAINAWDDKVEEELTAVHGVNCRNGSGHFQLFLLRPRANVES